MFLYIINVSEILIFCVLIITSPVTVMDCIYL